MRLTVELESDMKFLKLCFFVGVISCLFVGCETKMDETEPAEVPEVTTEGVPPIE